MAAYTLLLTPLHETALAQLVEEWQRSQPETAWTPDLVIERLVFSTLETTLRNLDAHLRKLASVVRQLPAPARAQALAALQGPERARLQDLLA